MALSMTERSNVVSALLMTARNGYHYLG